MFETFAALFFAHVMADFVLQTDKMAANKNKPLTLMLHGAIVYVTAALALGRFGLEPIALTIAHLVIDAVKAALVKPDNKHIAPFIIDQGLHLLTIIILAAAQPELWEESPWTKAHNIGGWFDFSTWAPEAMLLIAGLLYATVAGGFVVEKLMSPFAEKAPETSLPKGGMMIGHLERSLIFLLFFAGQAGGIGFLIAAKSVLRFEGNSSDQKDKNAKSEYIIIGTLASFSWAIAISILTMAIWNELNAPPVLEIIPEKP